MKKMIRQLYISAAIAAAALSPQVHAATLIDFEPPALTGLYFAGDSFTQNGYKMTVGFDAGIVDNAGAFSSGGPTGNPTQFYAQLNEGELILEREDGGLFSLDGFDAAFAPLNPLAGGTTALIVLGTFADATTVGLGFQFLGSGSDRFPFGTYNNAIDFANFTNVKQIEFFACSFNGTNFCTTPLQNNGQFALDNIHVTSAPIPEPTTVALFSLGLVGLALSRRRSAR